MKTKEEGVCGLCGGKVTVTKYEPPERREDEDGVYFVLDEYTCDSCGIEHITRLIFVSDEE